MKSIQFYIATALFFCLSCTVFSASVPSLELDLVILNGSIIDGTGSPSYKGDIGIIKDQIVAIGNLKQTSSKKIIDASERIVSPGFIDMLGQSDLAILVNPQLPSKIFQGITTEITGEGISVAPQTEKLIQERSLIYSRYNLKPDWKTFDDYFSRLEKQGIGINFASYVGATQVRKAIIGNENRSPTPDELAQMQSLVREAMLDGAFGLSTALEYAPAPYATTEELIALASEASKYGGIYATHMRSEGKAIFQALEEAVRIGREADIPVEIWHLKVCGKQNWGKMPQVIEFIEKQRMAGMNISANTYAYNAGFCKLSIYIPLWAHDGGDAKLIENLNTPAKRDLICQEMKILSPEDILICAVNNPDLIYLQGKNIAEIAALWKTDGANAICDILIQDNALTKIASFSMKESEVAMVLEQPWVSVCCDSAGTSPEGLLGRDHPHPRAYGTFARILRKYVREEKLLSLSEAIRKFSSLAAQKMKLVNRGALKVGMSADLLIFDLDNIQDLATYDNPNQLSQGMDFVIINGVPVIEDGKMTGALPGKVLRRHLGS